MFCHRICLALFVLFLNCNLSWAAVADFSWSPNSEPDIHSYRLYYGEGSRNYTDYVDVEPEVVNGRINGSIVGLDDKQTYYFTVTAFTTAGYESDYSREIVIQGSSGGGSETPDQSGDNSGHPPLEAGEIVVTSNWKTVHFESSFTQPVVIAKVISRNGTDPCVVRVRNVKEGGFDVRLQEWDYLDGSHGNEVVSYLVMEKGTYELSDGTRIEADSFTTSDTTTFKRHSFKQSYASTPVVVTSIATYNGNQAVTGRNKNVNRTGFDYLLQEQEANNDGHSQETVSYIAWQASDGTVSGLTYSVGIRARVNGNFVRTIYRAVKRDAFKDTPFVVTDMLTANGIDVAAVRCRRNSRTGIEVAVEEEKSHDGEIGHGVENVGYIALHRNAALPIEAGEVVINSNWKRVQFESSFSQPVVIAKTITHNSSEPCLVRVRNVSTQGFDVKLQEWDYQNGSHGNEVVSYLVLDRGAYELSDGTHIEAGSFETSETTSFARHNFKQSYGAAPVVMTSIVTYNGGQAVTGRNRNINRTGFEYLLQEQEANNDGHSSETVSYIVWDRSDGTIDGLTYSVGIKAGVGTNFTRAVFRAGTRDSFQDTPFVLTEMLTTYGIDTAVVRCRNNNVAGIEVSIEEERSHDGETGHSAENIGYIVVSAD